MTIEKQLKNLILTRYNSMLEFTSDIDIPYSTMDSIIKRGIQKATLSNVVKICKALHISVDALEHGEIVHVAPKDVSETNEKIEINDIIKIMNNTKRQLLDSDPLLLNGKPVDADSVNALIDAIDIGVEMVKRRNK